jgi:low temperature requirement protein LtrA
MTQKKFWLKLIGVALLVHIILIVLSIVEVAIYSYLINPGKDDAFYTQHANISGPWVSGIGGSIVMFFLVSRYVKRFSDRHLTYALMLPVIYVVTDIIILMAFNVNLADHLTTTVLANGAKLVGALGAYYLYRPSRE